MKEASKLIHKGKKSEEHFGTVNVPICQSSTLIFPTMEAYEQAEEKGEEFYQPIFDSQVSDPAYGISGNQTHFALQELLCSIEEANSCYLLPSGLSAITTALLSFLKAGDHLLMVDNVYGPTRRFCNKTLKSYNIETTFYNPEIGDNIKDLVKPNTKVIFLESPGSITFEVQDLESIVNVAKQHDIITIIDNSWATPVYCKPMNFGIDVSIHAVTKYLGGNSDLLLGTILTKKTDIAQKIKANYKNYGHSVSAYDCYLALRGIRSLKPRLEYQGRSLKKVLSYLASEDKVSQILCPAYNRFEGYSNWSKYFTGATTLFSVVLDKNYKKEDLARMVNGYKIFGIGASWGGFESLVRVAGLEGIRSLNYDKYDGSIVRFYIGLEDIEDIIEDLQKGFAKL